MSGRYFAFLLLFAILFGCAENNSATIKVKYNTTSTTESLFFLKYLTDEPLGELVTEPNQSISFNIDEPIVAIGKTNDPFKYILLVAKPGKTSEIYVDSMGIHSLSSLDTLLNYHVQSVNQVLARIGRLIPDSKFKNKTKRVFDSLLTAGKKQIRETNTNAEIKKLLEYQNKFRIYNFLFYYGRMVHDFDPEDDFFDFTKNITTHDPVFRSAPQLVLYKLEVDFLRANDSIHNVQEFVEYIDQSIDQEDDRNFVKAFYIKNLIERPQYWNKHYKVLNSIELKNLLLQETSNPYATLFEVGSKSYFSAMKGEEAYKFHALKTDSTLFSLSDCLGKLVVMDIWATWCAPCLQQKPYFEQLSTQFKNNEIEFISVSIDKSFSKWRNAILEKEDKGNTIEVNISNDQDTFSRFYNIQSIPRYILIDKDGYIIDADMEDPGKGMIDRINSLL